MRPTFALVVEKRYSQTILSYAKKLEIKIEKIVQRNIEPRFLDGQYAPLSPLLPFWFSGPLPQNLKVNVIRPKVNCPV